MYLNIINNIKLENSRKRNNLPIDKSHDREETDENEEITLLPHDEPRSYFSLFYGDLTKNWIYLKP